MRRLSRMCISRDRVHIPQERQPNMQRDEFLEQRVRVAELSLVLDVHEWEELRLRAHRAPEVFRLCKALLDVVGEVREDL